MLFINTDIIFRGWISVVDNLCEYDPNFYQACGISAGSRWKNDKRLNVLASSHIMDSNEAPGKINLFSLRCTC